MQQTSPKNAKSSTETFKLTFDDFLKLDLKQLQINIIGTENEYGFSFTLYKIQVRHPSIQTFICNRRYNEFYALHKVLKMKYCNLDLPQFPSKHEWLFKTEKRKAGFHLFLNKLVLIAMQHPQIQSNILKFLYYFLTRDLLGNQKQNIFASTDPQNEDEPDWQFRYHNLSTDDQNQAGNQKYDQLKKMAANVQLRFSDDEVWQTFYGKIQEGTLQLFQHISYNYFSCQIMLFQIKLELLEDVIFMYHDYDYQKIQLKPEDPNLLRLWYSQLKFASQEVLQCERMHDDFHSLGKVQIQIKEAFNLSNIIQDSFLFVKISFPPFTCQTKQHVYSNNPQWSQDYIFPIIDSFSVIRLELISEIQDGILKRKVKQSVIGMAEIQIADLLSYHSGTKFSRIQLPLNRDANGSDIFQFLKKQSYNLEEQQPSLIVTIRNMSSPLSLFGPGPVFSYENELLEPDLTVIKMNIIRFKRIISLMILFQLSLEDVVDQKYPRLTFIVFTFMFIFIFFADLNNILQYFGFILLFIMIYQHPTIHHHVKLFFDKYILCELNYYYKTPQLFTQEEKDLKKNTQSLDKVIKFEGNEIKLEVDDENEPKESFYQKLRAIKKTFFIVQLYLTYLSNFAEKVINLFTWQEYHRTLWFLYAIFSLYCIICILPIRYIMLAGIINEWFDGRIVFKKRQAHNQKIAQVMMEYIYKKHAPELVCIPNYLDVAFPKGDFRTKMANELLMHLTVSMNQEEANKYQNGNEVIRDLTTCSQRLKWVSITDHHFVRDQLYYELRKKGKFRMKPHYLVYYTITNFIYNIPSQYYRLRRPIQLIK
ncbi:unnamed protein product [Paramecium sonneborni]|uniref:PX domain-containing protein n=1 Tax=Paramecium sonneborni TaxID=65129 RepID=A0A8S1R2Y7_9CILI|nr:unnamed protein product [Paramecium sonneborni]